MGTKNLKKAVFFMIFKDFMITTFSKKNICDN